tara:strand:- start:339 stop:449 length:111 start_codon:yes stop_codon:yes gene_type:complete
MRKVLETLEANPKTVDGSSLRKYFARMHFANCPAGG